MTDKKPDEITFIPLEPMVSALDEFHKHENKILADILKMQGMLYFERPRRHSYIITKKGCEVLRREFFKSFNRRKVMQYRKNPVVIEAVKYDGSNYQHIVEMFGTAKLMLNEDRTIAVATDQGVVTAMPGSYIIRRSNGEIYPCTPELFAESYSQVVEEEDHRLWTQKERDILRDFSQIKVGPIGAKNVARLRTAYRKCCEELLLTLPDSRDRAIAVTELCLARMAGLFAAAALAPDSEFIQDGGDISGN